MHLQGPKDEIDRYLSALTKESRVARLITQMVESPGHADPGILGFRIES